MELGTLIDSSVGTICSGVKCFKGRDAGKQRQERSIIEAQVKMKAKS